MATNPSAEAWTLRCIGFMNIKEHLGLMTTEIFALMIPVYRRMRWPHIHEDWVDRFSIVEMTQVALIDKR